MTFFKNLLIIFFIFSSVQAWGWGGKGHQLITKHGAEILSQTALKNCNTTAADLVYHTTDPDTKWRQQRLKHRKEAEAHYFHVDEQPSDWKKRTEPKDLSNGYLVYRLPEWVELAKKQRKAEKWDALKETLYGITHYLGDLSQPLHLHHDHDGVEAGLPDLHAQYETRMVGQYDDQLDLKISEKMKTGIPPFWVTIPYKELIFTIAEQSFARAKTLFEASRPALQLPKKNKRRKNSSSNSNQPRFIKAVLWKQTADFTAEQMTLSSKLIAFTLNSICE